MFCAENVTMSKNNRGYLSVIFLSDIGGRGEANQTRNTHTYSKEYTAHLFFFQCSS